MEHSYTEFIEKFFNERFLYYHIFEELFIAFVCFIISLRSFSILRTEKGLHHDQNSRIFLITSAFIILGINSATHAFIHAYDLDLNLLYQTLLGYCLGLFILIVAISAVKPYNKKLLPFLYFPLLILLIPDLYRSFPLFSEFRPLVWIFVAYLSGVVCMLYIATYYKTSDLRFLYSAFGHLLICIGSIFLFFPSAIGSRMWLYGHLFRPLGFSVLLFSMSHKELIQIGGSILYRVLAAFSLLAGIPLLTFGITVFYENIHPIQIMSKRMLIFLLLMITLASALLFGLGLIIRLIRPILHLKDSVDTLVETGFNRKIDVNSNDEIGELGRAFNDMVSKLKQAMQEQDRLSRLAATGELAATLAHEIKNPLNAIGGAASYIKENFKGALIREFLQIISEEVSRINKLTTTLLSFAKPVMPEKQRVDINKLVKETLELLSQDIREDGINLKTDLQNNLPPVNCDPNHIKQLLINLLLNAFDAVDGSGEILVKTEILDGNLFLSVKDNGTGIKKEHMDQIFNPFFTTKTRGTGLGLAISKKIAKEHGGDLSVESVPGKGSKFTLSIPIE
jgi:signal transduction histidine kinase